jgi:hypothetical protein
MLNEEVGQVCSGGDFVPMPGILECLDLSGGVTAVTLGEEDVISQVAIERRVEIYEVSRLILDIASEYFQVIAIIQNVLCHYGLPQKAKILYGHCPARRELCQYRSA